MMIRHFANTIWKLHLTKFLPLCLLTFLLPACVSVNLPFSSKGHSAKNVSYQNPPANFVELKTQSGDKTWIEKDTKNTISFMSECGGADPSLDILSNEVHSVLAESEAKPSEKDVYNDREALFQESHGKIDGIQMKISSVVFKKNNCNYVLTYSGQSKNFEKHRNAFTEFLRGFKAP